MAGGGQGWEASSPASALLEGGGCESKCQRAMESVRRFRKVGMRKLHGLHGYLVSVVMKKLFVLVRLAPVNLG